jgi:hypothetical protein
VASASSTAQPSPPYREVVIYLCPPGAVAEREWMVRLLTALAREHNLGVVGAYWDPVLENEAERPSLIRLVRDMSIDADIDGVLVPGTDHLSRQGQARKVIERIEDTGASVFVVSVNDMVDPSDEQAPPACGWTCGLTW